MVQTMKGLTFFVVFAASIGIAQPQTSTGYSHSELQKMIAEAHTPQQYQVLATYFRVKQQTLEQQAQSEKVEWDRRSQITVSVYQKYPRPADSSRNRYEYFTYEAQQMGQQAAHFEGLVGSARQ